MALVALDEFTPETIRAAVDVVAERHGLKLREAVEPIRLAVFGEKISPPLFEVMPILGCDECVCRLTAGI